ncbi:MAG: isoaspartyl peptidase/L-asparaginase [Desulfurococcaceae archaeon]
MFKAWSTMNHPALLLHGGAGLWRAPRELVDEAVKIIGEALEHGWRFIEVGSAIEAVVESVSFMEDSGLLNAGSGSVLNIAGYRELDAGLMDGRSMRAGSVGGVKATRNPIKLAKIVMDETDHVMLVGEGADRLAKARGLPELEEPSKRLLERYVEQLNKYRAGEYSFYLRNRSIAKELGLLDTVGAVALDKNGALASAVSTGGIWLKMPGRVGDSAIPGAGFYADAYAAIAATGVGEVIILSMASLRVALLVSQGYSIQKASELVVDWVTERWGPGTIGLIGLSKRCEEAIAFNTEHILVSYKGPKGVFAKLL